MEGKKVPECPVKFEAMFFVGKQLHGLSKAGDLYAFYVYHPLLYAYRNHYAIPFAPSWDKYSKDVALHYLPVPVIKTILGDNLSSKITTQSRGGGDEFVGDPIRPWEQSLFQGWPLYFLQDKPEAEHVERPLEFWLAGSDIGTPVAYYGDTIITDGDGAPGPYIGP